MLGPELVDEPVSMGSPIAGTLVYLEAGPARKTATEAGKKVEEQSEEHRESPYVSVGVGVAPRRGRRVRSAAEPRPELTSKRRSRGPVGRLDSQATRRCSRYASAGVQDSAPQLPEVDAFGSVQWCDAVVRPPRRMSVTKRQVDRPQRAQSSGSPSPMRLAPLRVSRSRCERPSVDEKFQLGCMTKHVRIV